MYIPIFKPFPSDPATPYSCFVVGTVIYWRIFLLYYFTIFVSHLCLSVYRPWHALTSNYQAGHYQISTIHKRTILCRLNVKIYRNPGKRKRYIFIEQFRFCHIRQVLRDTFQPNVQHSTTGCELAFLD